VSIDIPGSEEVDHEELLKETEEKTQDDSLKEFIKQSKR
jgi:hypothetical protein